MKKFLNVKLMLFLLLSSMICFVGCNQANNKGKDNTNQTEAKHIVITLTGDEHVAKGKGTTFKVAKNTTWKEVKENANVKAVKFADNYELDVWKQDNATGTDLADTYVFATDKTIYAVSKTKVQQPKPEEIFEWDEDEGEGFIKRNKSFDKEKLPETLSIPNKLNGKDVTMISGSAFANCTKIKMIDFSQCTSLVGIGASSFEGCTNLEGKITLPASLTTIQTNAFQGCTKITEVISTKQWVTLLQ